MIFIRWYRANAHREERDKHRCQIDTRLCCKRKNDQRASQKTDNKLTEEEKKRDKERNPRGLDLIEWRRDRLGWLGGMRGIHQRRGEEKTSVRSSFIELVPEARLELAQPHDYCALNTACLPISPLGLRKRNLVAPPALCRARGNRLFLDAGSEYRNAIRNAFLSAYG